MQSISAFQLIGIYEKSQRGQGTGNAKQCFRQSSFSNHNCQISNKKLCSLRDSHATILLSKPTSSPKLQKYRSTTPVDKIPKRYLINTAKLTITDDNQCSHSNTWNIFSLLPKFFMPLLTHLHNSKLLTEQDNRFFSVDSMNPQSTVKYYPIQCRSMCFFSHQLSSLITQFLRQYHSANFPPNSYGKSAKSKKASD